tara:strand:+ start:1351 stop:1869 length:519 start_codon:yes stop_codon:yes gene_type:complete
MSDKELLETIKSNQLAILQHQEILKRMHDTVDQKFTEVIKKLDKFKKEFRVRKSLQNCLISQDLLSCGQNDMIYAINNLTEDFNTETRKTDSRINKLSKEMEILTQLFIHGEDIKTYDLSTTFPDAYTRIIELEKQRAQKSAFDYERIISSSPSETEEEMIPLVELTHKKDL